MVEDWLVFLDFPIARKELEQLGHITWISTTIPAFAIRIAPDRVKQLRRLPGVRRLEPPAS